MDTDEPDKASMSFCGTRDVLNPNFEVGFLKPKDYEEVVAAKDATIAVLSAELDSFREMTSNHSTLSLNTTTTDYKPYHEEFQNKVRQFQNYKI